MKVGIILQHFDRRNDVRMLVDLFARRHDVVLFAVTKQVETVDFNHEIRVIESRRSCIWNKFWNLCYLLFGNLPGNLQKYYDWRKGFFDSERSDSGLKDRIILELSTRLPALIDFDTYLRFLRFQSKTEIGDVDVLLGFTDVNDPYFLAHIRHARKPLVTYVYSWDHPAKYHRFSKSWIRYLTWNEDLKDDLVKLHGIPASNVSVVGSSQLCYVHEFIEEREPWTYRPYDGDYIYYAGAAGYEKVARQEVGLMRCVSEVVSEIDSSVKLVIRPYPVGGVFDFCSELSELPNVIIEDYREPEERTMFSNTGIANKLSAVAAARAYVHIGSTLGIEASYFDTPVIHLDLQDVDLGVDRDDPSSMEKLIHSFHGERYMLRYEYLNVVRTREELAKAIRVALDEPEVLLKYNRKLAAMTGLRSFDSVANEMMTIIEEYAKSRSCGSDVKLDTSQKSLRMPFPQKSYSSMSRAG